MFALLIYFIMTLMTLNELFPKCIPHFISFIICILSSFIFVFLLLKILSPKIKISPYIAKRNIDGKESYIFKIVNESMFDTYNVKFRLVMREPIITENNKVNHKTTKIELVIDELFCIPRYKKDKDYGDYAALIRTEFDLSKDICKENIEYELMVSASHGLSNITKVIRQRFDNSGNIHEKMFKFGKSLKINN